MTTEAAHYEWSKPVGTLSQRIRETVGRRGYLLMLAGIAWVLTGLQIVDEPRIRFSNNGPTSLVIFEVMDNPLWGWMWVICGGVAALIGLFRNTKTLRGHDDIGFSFLVTPVFVWALFFATSWVTWLFTDGNYGQIGASYGLVVWGLISAFILTIAGWPESSNPESLDEELANPRRRHGGKS